MLRSTPIVFARNSSMEGIRVVGIPSEGVPDAVAFDTGADPRAQVRGPSGGAGQPQFNPTSRTHESARSAGTSSAQESRSEPRTARQAGSDILVDLIMPIMLSLFGIAALFMYNNGVLQFGGGSSDSEYSSPFGFGFDGDEMETQQIRPQQLAVQIDLAQAFTGTTVKVSRHLRHGGTP